MGIIPIAVPDFYDKFPEWFVVVFDSGITSAAITAVLLNIVFNIVGRTDDAEGPIFAEAPPQMTISNADEERLLAEGHPEGSKRAYRPDAGQSHPGSVWEPHHLADPNASHAPGADHPAQPTKESDK